MVELVSERPSHASCEKCLGGDKAGGRQTSEKAGAVILIRKDDSHPAGWLSLSSIIPSTERPPFPV